MNKTRNDTVLKFHNILSVPAFYTVMKTASPFIMIYHG